MEVVTVVKLNPPPKLLMTGFDGQIAFLLFYSAPRRLLFAEWILRIL